MEGFLTFLAVLLMIGILIVPIILIVMVSGLKGQIDVLNKRFLQLLQELKNNAKPTVDHVTIESNPVEEITTPYATADHRAYMPQESVVEKLVEEPMPETAAEPEIPDPDIPILEQVEAIETEPVKEEYTSEPEPEIIVEETPVIEPEPEVVVLEQDPEPTVQQKPIQEKPVEQIHPPRPKTTPKEGFNFERFIGENLINKIGIGVLVIGIGLFVKYAIDNEWVNEVGRVAIGFLSGGVLLALAYRFRKAYRAFSSVLTGGAMVVFYFTVAIAFREYDLFGQTTSFLMMVVITAFSVWLSILYNRRELAILSLIGGMLTPFMVSRGDGNYHVLFTYIAILNIGMLTLSLRKQWKELLIISYIGTQLIFWLYYLRDSFNILGGSTSDITRDSALLLYASIFYVIFLLMPLRQVFRGKDQSKNHALHIILLIVNSFLYLSAGVLLLYRMEIESYKGLLTALLAVVNAIVALLLYNNQKDKVLFHLFAGLTISFVTLAAPMQFDGNNITLFWATEAILLLWLFRKSEAIIYYCGSLILLAFTFFSMLFIHNLQELSFGSEGHIRALEGSIFVNRYFITRLYASLAFVIAGLLLRRHYNEHPERSWVLPDWLPTAIGTVAAGMLFYTGNRELYMYTNTDYTAFWRMAYFFTFTWALSVIISRRSATSQFRFFALIALWAIGCLYYWFSAYELQHQLRSLVYQHMSYAKPVMLYWIGFAGLCGLFVVIARTYYKRYSLKSLSGKTMMWIFNIAAIINLSIAIIEAINQMTSYNDLYISNKVTITVLWSLCAFVQMWLGMRLKYKTLRIISLSLLGLVLCKLFMYDLSSVSQGAKIVAFVVLGIVLLVLSFLYQKLKKILFEDDDKTNINKE